MRRILVGYDGSEGARRHHGLRSSLFGADVAAEVQRAAGCDVIAA